MKELLLVPFAGIIILGFMTQLSDIALSTSEKALNYADEMDSAVDCAFRGIPIEVCSPNLMDEDFRPEAREFIEFNRETLLNNLEEDGLYQETYTEEEIEEILKDYNLSASEKGVVVIILPQ